VSLDALAVSRTDPRTDALDRTIRQLEQTLFVGIRVWYFRRFSQRKKRVVNRTRRLVVGDEEAPLRRNAPPHVRRIEITSRSIAKAQRRNGSIGDALSHPLVEGRVPQPFALDEVREAG